MSHTDALHARLHALALRMMATTEFGKDAHTVMEASVALSTTQASASSERAVAERTRMFFAAFQDEARALVQQKVLSRSDASDIVSAFARIAATLPVAVPVGAAQPDVAAWSGNADGLTALLEENKRLRELADRQMNDAEQARLELAEFKAAQSETRQGDMAKMPRTFEYLLNAMEAAAALLGIPVLGGVILLSVESFSTYTAVARRCRRGGSWCRWSRPYQC